MKVDLCSTCKVILKFVEGAAGAILLSLNIIWILSSIYLIANITDFAVSQSTSIISISVIFIFSVFIQRKIDYRKKYMGIKIGRLLLMVTFVNLVIQQIIR